MKLNNKGFGLQGYLIAILFFMLILVVTSVSINNNFNILNDNNKNEQIENNSSHKKEELETKPVKKTYLDLENEVKEATLKYQKKNYTNLVDGEKITVTIKTLVNDKLLEKINDIEDNSKCTGYGMFELKNDIVSYYAYLKCSNYISNGYNEIFDLN